MRLTILAHNMRTAGGLSVGRNIVDALVRIAPDHAYQIFAPVGCGFGSPEFGRSSEWNEVELRPLPQRMLWEWRVLRGSVERFRPDLIWALGNIALRAPGCRQALLFHDAHLVYPARHYQRETWPHRCRKRLLRYWVRTSLKSVEVVFCQTETVRRRFRETFGFSRTAVLPNAVSRFLSPAKTAPVLELPERPGGRFRLLMLTKYYPHKNLEAVVETFRRHRNQLADVVCVLTIAAEQHPLAGRLLRRIEEHGLTGQIFNVGPLPQERLGDYYNGSHALLLPTLLESFSGTYLEAMHFRRAILTSDLDFARDVCGDAAAYFDPWDPESIKNAIISLRDDPARRERLVEAGAQRLKQFHRTWPEIVGAALDELGVPHH